MGEDEVTLTSGLHAQAERTKKQERGEGATWPYPVEVQTKVQNRVLVLNHGGDRPARGRGRALPTT